MKAADCKCIKCGGQAVAFWPVIDPDIPSHPYCRKSNTQVEAICDNKIHTYKELLSFLDTLEVKKVDLEKEIYDAEKRFGDIDEMRGYRILIFDDEFRAILRYFFELGLKTKGE